MLASATSFSGRALKANRKFQWLALQELREGEADVPCLVHRAGGAVEDPSAGDDVGPVEMLLELRGVDEACELFGPFIGVLGDMGVA